MARTKKIVNEDITQEPKPETQVIIAPIIDTRSVVMQSESNFAKPEVVNFEVENKNDLPSKKTIMIYENGIFLEELDEDSEKIDEYLSLNKQQLESNIAFLKEIITDPNTLIYFHEGVQPRKYLTFESYYAQNGLAPKSLSINSWMDYYKKKFHLSTEEEIAIKVKGNLKYSFTLKTEEQEAQEEANQ